MPATLQATIAARIDRLDAKAKRTLNAAAVVGTRFTPELITALGIPPVVDELVAARLIDQVRFTRQPEYVFHHPLIRRVAYESQLMSDRAELHRRLAASIQERNAESLDEKAALIAEHLEAAGELPRAYSGTCVPPGGWRTGTLPRRDEVGSAPEPSLTPYPRRTLTGSPCASPRARCCAEPRTEVM